MPRASSLKGHILAAVLGSLAYAAALLVWFGIGCASKFYVSCTYDLTSLPFMLPIVASAGLITHAVTATAALVVGGVRRMGALPTVGLYAASGFLLMGLWFAVTGSDPITDYAQFATTLAPFLASGAALGLVVWAVLGQRSNSTPHADTRASSALDQPPSARAGERRR